MAETDDGPILALATTRAGQGVGQALVVRGEYAREGMAGLENSRDTFELPRESLELLLGAALAEGLERGRLAPGGLIDMSRSPGGLAELRPRTMTVQDWMEELDPEGEIAGLAAAEREALVEESASWPGRHRAVEAWSEGTAMYREAVVETPSGDGTEEAFWARMEERREGWVQTMLRAAYVLKSAGADDWRSFAATAMALLDGRVLKTVPIMDSIYAETLLATLRENVGRMSEGNDGSEELARLIAGGGVAGRRRFGGAVDLVGRVSRRGRAGAIGSWAGHAVCRCGGKVPGRRFGIGVALGIHGEAVRSAAGPVRGDPRGRSNASGRGRHWDDGVGAGLRSGCLDHEGGVAHSPVCSGGAPDGVAARSAGGRGAVGFGRLCGCGDIHRVAVAGAVWW